MVPFFFWGGGTLYTVRQQLPFYHVTALVLTASVDQITKTIANHRPNNQCLLKLPQLGIYRPTRGGPNIATIVLYGVGRLACKLLYAYFTFLLYFIINNKNWKKDKTENSYKFPVIPARI